MNLFRKNFFKLFNLRRGEKNPIINFTALHHMEAQKKQKNKNKNNPEEEDHLNIGRSWKTRELNLKSNEDLHKLWYVFLKEKNSILSDASLHQRTHGEKMDVKRLERVDKSMNRLKVLLEKRKELKSNYKIFLEDKYTNSIKDDFREDFLEKEKEEELNPEITHEMLRAKYMALKEGNDNLDYLETYVKMKKEKKNLKKYLKRVYNYYDKKVINVDNMKEEQKDKLAKSKYIFKFENQIKEQMKLGKTKISQEEVLRAHVKNWKMLDLKQRRVVTNFLNARRSNDAKTEFMKELDLLAQKIAYENKKMEI